MLSLRDLIFTPEASQSQQRFHSPIEVANEHAEQATSKSIAASARRQSQKLLEEEEEQSILSQRRRKSPKLRKPMTPTDKSLPRPILSMLPQPSEISSRVHSVMQSEEVNDRRVTDQQNAEGIYRSAPQFSDQLLFNNKPLQYAQNYLSYLKFPQDNNFLPNQRSILREIWLRCYHGKDYIGALMALNTLAEVDYVFPEDLEKLLDMLDQANVSNGIGLEGAMVLFQQHLQVMSDQVRGLILKSFIQFLFGQGDIKSAKNILRRFRSHTSSDQQSYFLVCDALLSCYNIFQQAKVIVDSTNLKNDLANLPVLGQLVADPFLFYFPVKMLYHFSKGHLDDSIQSTTTTSTPMKVSTLFSNKTELVKKKLEVGTLLKEAYTTFLMAMSTQSALDLIDFQTWYVSFLLGYNLPAKVTETFNNLFKYIEQFSIPLNVTHALVTQQAHSLYARALIIFSGTTSHLVPSQLSDDISGVDVSNLGDLIRVCTPLHVETNDVNMVAGIYEDFNGVEIYKHWFRCYYGLESIDSCISYLANYIEFKYEQPQHIYECQQQWMVWKMLATLLGTLPTYRADEDPVDIDHPIGLHIPELVYANQLYANIDQQEYLHQRRNQQGAQRQKNDPNHFPDPRYPTKLSHLISFRRDRLWWQESYLSASQLDDFSASLIEVEMEEILNIIDNTNRGVKRQAKQQKQSSNSSFAASSACMNVDDEKHDDKEEKNGNEAHLDIASFECFPAPKAYTTSFSHPFDYWQSLRKALSRHVIIPDHELEEDVNETMIMSSLNKLAAFNNSMDTDCVDTEYNSIDPVVDFSSVPKTTAHLPTTVKDSVQLSSGNQHHQSATNETTSSSSSSIGSEAWLPFGAQSKSAPSFYQELYAMILNHRGIDPNKLNLLQFLPLPTEGDVKFQSAGSKNQFEQSLTEIELQSLIDGHGGLSDLPIMSSDILNKYYDIVRKELGLPQHRFSAAMSIVDSYHRPAHALWYSSLPTPGRPNYRVVQIPLAFMDDSSIDNHANPKTKEKLSKPRHYYSNHTSAFAQRLRQTERMRCYDSGDLEVLTFQALVSAHLSDQDNFFTVRVVQILCHHAIRPELVNDNESTATECLAYLASKNVNIRRCIAKGLEFACRNVPTDQAPALYYLSHRAGPLLGQEFLPRDNEDNGAKINTEADALVDAAGTESSSSTNNLEKIVDIRRNQRRKGRQQMATIYRDQAHEVELVAGIHTFYDPIQFEPRKTF